jgi:hypothetical protein
MIKDQDILFVTTTLYTKWLGYQKQLIKKHFPESEHIVVDGRNNWPYAWFHWLNPLKNTSAKWFVHLDEDCFLNSREELLKLIQKMEDEGITLSAVSDGYHHYRGANPVAINSFFMVGNVDHFNDLNFDTREVTFEHNVDGWRNNKGIIYNADRHRSDFVYPHEIMENGENCSYEQEPYYMILWMLKEKGRKFNYLYPHFDERFKSTNPRVNKDSDDIAIHMWYTRQWESSMVVHDTPNSFRYNAVEEYINKNML